MPFMLQGNPANFDIRAYLREPMIYWTVNRYLDQITLADHMFIWESGQSGGVVAYGIVNELVSQRKHVKYPEHLGTKLWLNGTPDDSSLVVGIQLMKTLHSSYFISRNVVKQDAVLSSLDVLRMPQGTVYQCSQQQVIRLLQM